MNDFLFVCLNVQITSPDKRVVNRSVMMHFYSTINDHLPHHYLQRGETRIHASVYQSRASSEWANSTDSH